MSQATTTLFAGIDAHQETLWVSVLEEGAEHPEAARKIANEPRSFRRLFRQLLKRGAVRATYEAGCLGFYLQRQLRKLGVDCEVAAPSLVPVLPGDRRKTDRLDSGKLARHLRAGQLTFVRPPTPEHEAFRSLTRTRAASQKDLVRAMHRVTKFLLTRGLHFRDGTNWTLKYMRWVRAIELPVEDDRRTLTWLLDEVEHRQHCITELDKRIEHRVQAEDCAEAVSTLRAFRGIDTVTAAAIHAEIGDVRRFPSAKEAAGYTALDDVEHSSAGRGNRAGISRSGNRHLRRLLIEAAQKYQGRRLRAGVKLRRRRRTSPRKAVVLAEKADRRLGAKYARLAITKHTNVAKAAIARELMCCLWAALHPDVHP